MHVFVTGGSGFIGRHLIPRLRARGAEVLALARSESARSTVEAAGAKAFAGDLSSVAALEEGMRGCDAVIHAAASTREWGTWDEFHEANVAGTERALAAARGAQVRRFVHVSTEAVLFDGAPLVQVDETRPIPQRSIGLYPATKALAEKAALAASRDGLEVVVVRPRLVWGPGDSTVLPKLVEAVKSGRFAWVGGGAALTSTCHVENACEGIALALERGRAGEVYFLTDGPPVTVREFLTALLATQKVDPGERSVPLPLARAGAAVVEGIWSALGVKSTPPLQRIAVMLIGQEVTVRDDKARRELGYQPVITREQGLQAMAAT